MWQTGKRIVPFGYEAVSYTHLDVYKRQEQCHGTEIQRFLHTHVVHFCCMVGTDLRVHLALDLGKLDGRERLEMGKVEAQFVRRHQ